MNSFVAYNSKGIQKIMAKKSAILGYPVFRKTLAFLASLYIRFVHMTSSWDWIGREYPESYIKNNKPFLTCFWHGRLVMLCYAWPSKTKPFHMLISHHHDGKLISEIVGHFGIKTISGSTNRGGTKALKQIVDFLKNGNVIGITPDGPRGPCHSVSEGTVAIAKLAGVDVLPVTFSTSRHKIFSSWDQFFLALPFSKGVIAWGSPISGKLSKDKLQENIRQALIDLNHQADGLCLK